MACVTALCVGAVLEKMKSGHFSYDLTHALNGALTGLVSITAGCSVFEPWAAAVVGMVAGVIYLLVSHLLIKLRIDDAVDAIPVHLGGGLWGVVATGLFASPSHLSNLYDNINDPVGGWFYAWSKGSGDATMLGVQLLGLLFIIGWTTAIMLPFFLVLSKANLLRVDALEEDVGLDISHHYARAYNLEGPDKAQLLALMKRRRERDKDRQFGRNNRFEAVVRDVMAQEDNKVRFDNKLVVMEDN
uniref:Ammonium transporter AmtB-like domain-containing protein n=1 Tax=Corethron hystrix TaxID=216773 RepID=A0A6U5E2K1_9STRA|mmetsp:Transcript_15457/g.34704  ORF Transcript_15457/g.34704 Transcript_15457/m.34704 type:complete len:244 (+) Transcript_15457:1499-2230(+)